MLLVDESLLRRGVDSLVWLVCDDEEDDAEDWDDADERELLDDEEYDESDE